MTVDVTAPDFGIPQDSDLAAGARAELVNAILREDFASFIHKTVDTLNTTGRFHPNWHIEAMCWRLQQCHAGQIKRLIITVPPRHLKSICASVAFTAWLLGHDPTLRIICVSYSEDLARKHARDFRRVIVSPWYRHLFPRTRIDPRKCTETEIETTAGGYRYTTSVGGTLTGRGGNFIIIDDPLKPQDAHSGVKREATNEWYDGTVVTRLDSKVDDVIILVMQRLHEEDLAGHILEKEEWDHLDIPAIADRGQVYDLGPHRQFRRQEGEILHPEREPLEVLDRVKATLGTYSFSAQYLQRPIPVGGNLIKWAWFKRYAIPPERTPQDQVVQSWDTASKDTELADYSVCTTWLVREGDAHLLNLIRERLDYPSLRRRVLELAGRWQPDAVLIEDKSSGTSLLQDLEGEGISCVPISPEADKVTRMSTVSPRIEGGRVWLPEGASWLGEFEKEVLQFPRGRHDDQVDSMSQLLNWLRIGELNRVPAVAPFSILKSECPNLGDIWTFH